MVKQKIDYKEMSAELNDVLSQMQSSDIDVDDAIKLYERGMKLTQQLQEYLQQAENNIIKVKKKFEAN